MTSKIVTSTEWFPEKCLIVTNLSGNVTENDVSSWETSFNQLLGSLGAGQTFKIFVNLFGFKAIDLSTHKRFRTIIPKTLAEYGWKVGYVDLFVDEASALTYSTTRGITCVKAAHAHDDTSKMKQYDALFSSNHERFFSDPMLAQRWIEAD